MNAHLLDPSIGCGTKVGKVLILIIRKEVSREIGVGKRRAACMKKLQFYSHPSSFSSILVLCVMHTEAGAWLGVWKTFIPHGNPCENESCMRVCQGKGYQ